MDKIAFIGAGRVAQTLAPALAGAGWPVVMVGSRNRASATRLADQVSGCVGAAMQDAAACDVVFLTVPDDTIAVVSQQLTWRPGQKVIHCSGATELAALDSAARHGALTGGFHPLQIFSDPAQAMIELAGSSVAIEGSSTLLALLRDMAVSLGMRTLELPQGGRALYHAGAGYAASLMLPLLHEAIQLWRHLGINEQQALQALLPLAHGTLRTVAGKGLAGALSGPVSRDDVGVVNQHLKALATLGPEHTAFYSELTARQLPLALESARLNRSQLERWARQFGELLPENEMRPHVSPDK